MEWTLLLYPVVNQFPKIFPISARGNHLHWLICRAWDSRFFLPPFSRTNGVYCPGPSLPLSLDSWGGCTGRGRTPDTLTCVYRVITSNKSASEWVNSTLTPIPTSKESIEAETDRRVSNFWHDCLQAGHGEQRLQVSARASERVESGCCLAQSWLLDVSAQPSLLLLLLLPLLSNMSLLFRALHQRAASRKTRRVESGARRSARVRS